MVTDDLSPILPIVDDRVTESEMSSGRDTDPSAVVAELRSEPPTWGAGTATERRHAFVIAAPETIARYLVWLNARTRGLKPDNHGITKHQIAREGWLAPNVDHKGPLLREGIRLAQAIVAAPDAADVAALASAALCLDGLVDLVLPFSNGNRGTSRINSYLLMRGCDAPATASADLTVVVSHAGRDRWTEVDLAMPKNLIAIAEKRCRDSSGIAVRSAPGSCDLTGLIDTDESSVRHLACLVARSPVLHCAIDVVASRRGYADKVSADRRRSDGVVERTYDLQEFVDRLTPDAVLELLATDAEIRRRMVTTYLDLNSQLAGPHVSSPLS